MVDFENILEMIPEGWPASRKSARWEVLLCWQRAAGREDGSTRVAMPAMPAGAVGCSA